MDQLQFVSFFLEDRLYGLDIRVVKEITPSQRITAVPLTPAVVRGLVNIRGQVVLVMDLALIFGRSERPVTEESQIVILKTAAEINRVHGLGQEVDGTLFGDKPTGFIVDNIGDVTSVTAAELKPPPPHLDQANARYFKGVVRRDPDLQIVLDAGAILAGSYGDSRI